MATDKYTATWVSHSSISDFLKCPKAYYLKNVYKDPKTKHKILVTSPALSLGAAVHEVIEALSVIPTKERFSEKLVPKLEKVWEKYSGKKGGFFRLEDEHRAKERAMAMLRRVELNPGPLLNLAVKLSGDLPQYWLSEEDNIILCGKLDWLEYLPDSDSIRIIDFKTGKHEEAEDSLQLPIYYLLASKIQKRKVAGVSYWYLESDDAPRETALGDMKEAEKRILGIAKQMKAARQMGRFICPQGGCFACRPLERVLDGEGEFVGVDGNDKDVYVLPDEVMEDEGVIL